MLTQENLLGYVFLTAPEQEAILSYLRGLAEFYAAGIDYLKSPDDRHLAQMVKIDRRLAIHRGHRGEKKGYARRGHGNR